MAIRNSHSRLPMILRAQRTRSWYRSLESAVLMLALIGSMMALTSCSGSLGSGGRGSKYRYQFKMLAPAPSNEMLYEDDSLIIQFRFDEAAVRFQLQNLSGSDLSIDWEKTSIGVENRFYSVRHSSDFYGDTLLRNISGIIPPVGYVRELMIPRHHVYFDGSRWVETEIFPTTDSNLPAMKEAIHRNVGKTVSVALPMKFGQSTKTYRFDFAVASVDQIEWALYRQPKRSPSRPTGTTRPFGSPDHLTTAIIAAGIVGFSALVLLRKKDPPVE